MFAVIALLFTIEITVTSVVFTNIGACLIPCFTAAYEVVSNMIEACNKDRHHYEEGIQIDDYLSSMFVTEPEEVKFIKFVKEKDYKIREVPRDENCMFHAISDQLKLKKIAEKTYKELREMAVKPLAEDLTQVSQ